MHRRRLLISAGFLVNIASVASALPLDHYIFTKITDADITVVTQGKSYFYKVQAADVNGNIPTSGTQASVKFDCGGVTPCNMTILAPVDSPPGSGRYTPDPIGALTILVRFDVAPDSLLLTATNANTPSIFGNIPVTVQKFPTQFSFSTPLTVNAGVAFSMSITALDVNNNTVTSFRDDVNLYDNIVRSPVETATGTACLNGACTINFILFAGDPVSHQNKINAVNSAVYNGQSTAASGLSGNITVTPAAYNRVVLIFPGETLTPGVSPGKNSSGIITQTAGVPVGTAAQPVKVYATDQYYNPLEVGIPGGLNIGFTSSVVGDTIPGSTALISNPLQFVGGEFIFPTVGSRVIDAQPSINPGNASQSTVVVKPGPVDHYTFTTQPAAGSVLLADDPTGGGTNPAFTVTITAYDASNNIVTSLNGTQTGKLTALLQPGAINVAQIVDTNPSTLQPDNALTFVKGVAVINQLLITEKWPQVQLEYDDGAGHSVLSNQWTIQEGSPKQILLTLLGSPGQTYTPGQYPGNSGNPPNIVAGTVVTAEARVCDGRWNIVSGAAAGATTVTILGQTANNYLDVTPPTSTFPPTGEIIGSSSIQIRYRTAGTQYVIAQAGGTFSFATNSSNITVTPGTYSNMILVGPGEILRPGIPPSIQPDGKEGTITPQQAGVNFAVSAYATDSYFNPIVSFTYPQIDFTFQDPNHTISPATPMIMGANREDFQVSLQSLVLPQITVFDAQAPSNPNKRQTISVNIAAGPLDHFVINTIPSPQQAGQQFNVTIQAQDQFNNTIPQNFTVNLAPNTGAGTMSPTQVTLTNGLFTGPITMFASTSTAKITMSMPGQPQATRDSNTFAVDPSPLGYKKLLLLLPGELIAQGTTVGKTGSPTPTTAGVVVIARAIACDPFHNPVNVTGTVQFSSDHYAQFGSNPGDLVNVNGHGEYATTLLLRTATTHNIVVKDVNNDATITRSTSSIQALVGTYKQIQILAPGETADPGTFVQGGKTGTPTAQKVATPFNVTMNAVDNYWNVVNYSGGDTRLFADISAVIFIPANNNGGPAPLPFTNGTTTRQVIVGQQGDVQILVVDDLNLTKPGQTVQVHVNPGPVYVFHTPTSAVAGQPFSPVTITLEENGVPVAGYNRSVFLSATLVSGGAASGSFNPDGTEREYVMNNGSVTITDLTYAYSENIKIKARDEFARVGFSNAINVVPSGLKYEVTVPATGVAGPPSTFNVMIRLLDTNTNTLVRNHDHTVDIAVLSAINPITSGVTSITSANLAQGVATIAESYTKAESVIVKASEDPTAGDPNYTIPSRNSSNTNIVADGYKKLLLLPPGESQVAGVPSATGKTGASFAQQKGQAFLMRVEGVDQYWNTVTNFNGGSINFISDDLPPSLNSSNPVNQNASLVNGESASYITLNNPGNIKVTIRDLNDSAIGVQSDIIKVGGLYYKVDNAPTEEFAGPPTVFTLNVTLFDSNTNLPVIAANNSVVLEPMHPDGTVATGFLGVTNAQLANGTVGITNESYSIAEDVFIHIKDSQGNTGSSPVIHFIPRQVRYTFDTPADATVNAPFNVTIKAIDQDTGAEVKNLNRTNTLQAFSAITGLPAAGTFVPNSVNIVNGVGQVSAVYNIAESIFLKMTDATPPNAKSPPTQLVFTSQGTINVHPGALDSISGIVDFTMASNETKNFTMVAKDAYGNIIPGQTLVLTVNSIQPPAGMFFNGQSTTLSAKTNSQGELALTIKSAIQTNGPVELLIKDGDRQGGFSKLVNIAVNGLTLTPARALGLGENRVPVHSHPPLDVNVSVQSGGVLQTFYRLDGGPWTLYDPAVGISGLDQTKQYAVEWFTKVSYGSNVISTLDINGAPNLALITTYIVEDHISGYPSPFNPKDTNGDNFLTIQYPATVAASKEINIYDLFGQKVWHTTIDAGQQGAEARPDNRVFWFGINDQGMTVANGGYIVTVKDGATGQTMKTKVMVVQ